MILKVCQALVVLPTLQYASEAWTTYRKLNHFHLAFLRKILNIKWQDKIPYTEVLTRANQPSIYTIQVQSQLLLAGQVSRMEDSRIPKGSYMVNKRMENAEKGTGWPRGKKRLAVNLQVSGLIPGGSTRIFSQDTRPGLQSPRHDMAKIVPMCLKTI